MAAAQPSSNNSSGRCYEKVELADAADGVGLVTRTKRRCDRWRLPVGVAALAFVLGCLVSFAVTALVFWARLDGGIGGGGGVDTQDASSGSRWIGPATLRANRAKLRALVSNSSGLERHVAALSSRQSRAGTPGAAFHANYVANEWRRQGITNVFNRSYNVLLSHLDKGAAGAGEIGVQLCRRGSDGGLSCYSRLLMDAPITPQEVSADSLPSIVPFTKPLIGDYQLITLERLKLAVEREKTSDSLSRYLSNKVILGDRRVSSFINITVLYMTAGVLKKLAIESKPDVVQYPNGTGVPKSVISMKTTLNTNVNGDPTTPLFPSKPYAVRVEGEPQLTQPDHPTVPISEADVEVLKLFAEGAEDNWLRISWPMRTQLMPVMDVCAELPGVLEPDRAVLVGGHRDAWHSGALDPHSGLSSLLELSGALAQLQRTGWRPRRTLLLCTWDAEEWNLIGSAEWLDEEILRANRRLVGYVNTDTDIMGNWKVMVHAFQRWHGFLDDLIVEVPNPDLASSEPNYHFYVPPDAYSDYYIFWRNLGVPIVDLSYIRPNEPRMVVYDLYHSRYDTLTLYRLTDPGGRAHLATLHNYLGIVYTLLDAPILPTNLTAYAEEIQHTMSRLYQLAHNGSVKIAGARAVNTENWLALRDAFYRELAEAVKALRRFQTDRLNQLNDTSSLLEQRMINDKVMEVQKAFVYRSTYPHQDVVNLLAEEGSLRVFRRIFREELHDSHEFQQRTSARNRAVGDNTGVKQRHLEKLLETCILSLASVPKLLSDTFAT